MRNLFKTSAFAVASLATVTALAAGGNPQAVGDVMGRDMAVTGLGWLGHVGIYDGSKALEVLNEATVIQKNTVANFKGKAKYWGARYGKGSNLYKVTDTGWNQRNYSPSYTTTAQYQEGGLPYQVCVQRNWYGGCTKSETRKTTAKFRCDTFSMFSYLKGAGVNLTSSGASTPSIIYKNMPKER